jgi:hypothetical protein
MMYFIMSGRKGMKHSPIEVKLEAVRSFYEEWLTFKAAAAVGKEIAAA